MNSEAKKAGHLFKLIIIWLATATFAIVGAQIAVAVREDQLKRERDAANCIGHKLPESVEAQSNTGETVRFRNGIPSFTCGRCKGPTLALFYGVTTNGNMMIVHWRPMDKGWTTKQELERSKIE